MIKNCLLGIGLGLLLTACAANSNRPTDMPPASPTVSRTPSAHSELGDTSAPTDAPMLTDTAIPSATPSATALSTRQPTSTDPPAGSATMTPDPVSDPTSSPAPPTTPAPETTPATVLPSPTFVPTLATPDSPSLTPSPLAETAVAPAPDLPPPPVGPEAPRVYETTLTIPTYNYEQAFQATAPDDPIYPYPRLDLSQVGPPVPRTYQAVVLENGYVALTILPELGGRVYRWVDKATGRQLLYENPVVKPTHWGYRGWWLSAGGIEWAFPVEEHGLNEWRPWTYSTGYTAHGLAVTVSNVEDRTGMAVGATISLDADHAYVTLQPWARNDTAEAHPYELWLNAMLTLGGNAVSGRTQFIVPASQVTVHSTGDGGLPGPGAAMNWPVYGGRDMSWYSNWGGYLGFFVPSVWSGFVGLYDHDADQGIVRVFTPGWPAGTKFFGPAGLSPTLWTDDGSQYVELWSGATSSFGQCATLNPGEQIGWVERWYPLNGLGGFNHANVAAALRLTDTGGGAQVGVAVSALTTGHVTLWAGGQEAARWSLTLYPGQAFRIDWARPSDLNVGLGLTLTDANGALIAQTGEVP